MTNVPSTGGLHNEHSFLTILAARRSKIKIKVPADSVSGSWILSLFSHVVGGKVPFQLIQIILGLSNLVIKRDLSQHN